MKDVTCLQCSFFAAAATTQPRHREKKRDRQGEEKELERKKKVPPRSCVQWRPPHPRQYRNQRRRAVDLMQESKRSKTLDSLTTRERFLKGWVRGSFFKAWLTRLRLGGLQGLGLKVLRFRGLGFRIVILGFVLR